MNQVIVVGAGIWGRNLVKNFYQLGALAGVVEVNSSLREQIAQTYPDVPIYEEYHPALATDIPAVVLATPAPTHYQLALTALEAGKDVFVEKPMTLQTSEARHLAE